jgi:G3E family GTPase
MTAADRDSRVPVTVLTGFLGSGKTTLLNRILTGEHGRRIAVIENEFGEVGVDDALVLDSQEEIFEMNNGCICCTVRGDLIRILGALMRRRDSFDRIIVETTGLAGSGRQYVFQGVHMLFDGANGRAWRNGERRANRMVFIGRNLDRAELEGGFAACLAGVPA